MGSADSVRTSFSLQSAMHCSESGAAARGGGSCSGWNTRPPAAVGKKRTEWRLWKMAEEGVKVVVEDNWETVVGWAI